MSLDGRALAQHLRAWSPPADLPAPEREPARHLDEAFDRKLAPAFLDPGALVGRVARQRWPRFEWVRVSNPYSTVLAGVGALMVWFVASNVIRVLGFLGFLSVLLMGAGGVVTAAATLVGFGAVLLTRGGRWPVPGTPAETGEWGDPWDDDLEFGSHAPTAGSAPTAAHGAPAGDTNPPAGSEREKP